MNDIYYTISPSYGCVYMTTGSASDYTTLPPEPGKTIIYFTSKELAKKYIKNITTDDELRVSEIQSRDVNKLEWICCYDYNIPFKINGFVQLILFGFFLSGFSAFLMWVLEGVKSWVENPDLDLVTVIGFMGFSVLFIHVLFKIMRK
ncbi:hypothetical protein FAP59_16880 [Morganella morganii]|nr:hypothetical protein [Morganella morganii]